MCTAHRFICLLFCVFFTRFSSVQIRSVLFYFVLFCWFRLLCLLYICWSWINTHYHLFSPQHYWMFAWEERALKSVFLLFVDIVTCILHATHACLPSAHNCLRWKKTCLALLFLNAIRSFGLVWRFFSPFVNNNKQMKNLH